MALSDEILADLKAKKSGGGKPMPPMRAEPAAEPDEDDSGDYAGDEETAASEVMAAKDPAAWAEAMRGFLDICVPKIMDGLKGGVE